MRLALGAGRRHLARQLLLESLLLGLISGALGVLVAFWSIEPISRMAPSNTNVSLLERVDLEPQVVLFSFGLALATSLLFGLVPLRQLFRDCHEVLSTGAAKSLGDRVRHRTRSSLVISELALSMVLLIGTGLMVRTLMHLRGLDLGFSPEKVLVLRAGARGPGFESREVEIVGVAGDLRGLVQSPEPPPILFLPLTQQPTSNMSFMIRTALADPMTLKAQAEDAIWDISHDVPVYGFLTLEQLVSDLEWQPRFVMQLLAGFALLALVLAATGIYAVLAFAVAERTREIGVRVAVGARRGDILRMVQLDALRLAALGVTLGLGGAWLASRFLASQLQGVTATDPATYGVLAVVLTAVALFASSLPALRATRVDPVVALRSE